MKNTKLFRNSFRLVATLTLLLALGVLPSAQAGSATWNLATGSAWLTTANWNPNTSFPGVAGTGANSDVATFSTVAISGNACGINMNSLTGNSLSLGSIYWNMAAGAAATIGNSSTAVNGTLQLNSASVNVGGTGGTIGNLLVGVGDSATQDLTIQNANNGGNKTMGVTLSADGAFYVTGGRTLTISSAITGTSRTITKSGAGALAVSANNSAVLTGASWLINEGRFCFNNASCLGAATSTLTLGGGNLDNTVAGTPQIAGQAYAQNWNSDFTFLGSGASLNLGVGAVTLGANVQVTVNSVANSLTVGGVIGGIGKNLTKAGIGLFVLNGADTYTGTTTVNNGILRLGNATALPGGIGLSGGTSALTLNGGVLELGANDLLRNLGSTAGTFQIIGGTSGFSAYGGLRNVIINNNPNTEIQWGNVSGTFSPTALVLNEVTATDKLLFQNRLDLNGTTRTINVNAGTAEISGNIRTTTGTAGLTKGGSGTLILSGNNTYNGAMTVNGGVLYAPTPASLPGYTSPGNVVFGGGTVACTMNGSGWTTGNIDTLMANAIKTSGALGIDTSNGDLTQWVTFDTTYLGSALGLNKFGANTLTLNQVNNYAGATIVSGGTLKLLNPGGTSSQSLNGGLAIAGPDVTLLSDNAGGNWTTSFGTVAPTRTTGSTLNISLANGTPGVDNIINLGGSLGFVNAGVFYNGADFAWLNAANGALRAPNYGVDANTVNNPVSPVATFTATSHYRLTGSLTQTSTGGPASLKVDGGGGGTLTQTTGALTVPAILKTGGGAYSFTGGALRGSSGNIVVRTDTSSDQFIVLGGADTAMNMTKSGAGTLTLSSSSGNKSYIINNIYLNGGTLEIASSSQLTTVTVGTQTSPLFINSGATFLYNSSLAQTLSGAISGGGSLTKSNTGTLTLSGANYYTGVTTVSGGQLIIQNGTALGTTTGNTVVASGAEVFAGTAGLSVAEPFNIAGNGTAAANGALHAGGSVTTTFTGPITLSGNATVKADGNATAVCSGGFTIGANTLSLSAGGSGFVTINTTGINGTGGLVAQPTGLTGTVNLNTSNTFSGPVTVSGGTVAISSIDVVANPNPLGQSSTSAANLLLGNTTTLKYTGSGGTCDRSFTINGTLAGNQATLDASGTGPVSFTSTASPAYGTVDQSRVLILTGSNTGSNTLAANIANNGAGAVQIQKNGVGKWVLTGANVYTGPTIINAGTLALGAAGALSSSTAVTLNGATLDAQTYANSGGALEVTNAGTINLGSGGTLAFADSSAKTWGAGGGTLNITGTFVSGASLRFGTTSGGLTSGQLNKISVNGSGAGTYVLDANGYLAVGSTPTTTTVSLSAGSTPSTYGSTLTFKAAIVPSSGSTVPTGTVQFKTNGVSFGSPVTLVTDVSPNGKAEISGSTLPYNASAYTVTAVYTPANSSFLTSSDNTGISQTINLALLTVTANNFSKSFDGVPFAGGNGVTYSGFVNGETNTVLTGTLVYTGNSQGVTNVGSYDIIPSGLSGANYNVSFNNGTLTINQASTFVGAASSVNPSGYKDAVAFIATLPAYATGNVVFSSTNGSFSTNALDGGSPASTATSLSITNLPRGTNAITVAYFGDSHYLGSTNVFNQIVTNHPPVVMSLNVARTAGMDLKIFWSQITNQWSDMDGDIVTLSGITLSSANNVTVLTNNLMIFYPAGDTNIADQLSYTATDGQGAIVTGQINVSVNQVVTGMNSITTIQAGNPTTLTAYGVIGYSYITQRSTNMTDWVSIATNTVSTNGPISVTDGFGDLGGGQPASAFYRLLWQP